jgi:hypothetical protein
VVQLDPPAPASQRPGGGQGVQREAQGAARVVGGRRALPGLVVDDDELAVAQVDPVDPSAEHEAVGARRHGALDAERLVVGVERGGVALTMSAARDRHRADCAASAKPSGTVPCCGQASSSRVRAPAGLRRSRGADHQRASATCTAAPIVVWAQACPRGVPGRSTYVMR